MAVDPEIIERATKFLRSRGLDAASIEKAIEVLSKSPPAADADNPVEELLAKLKTLINPVLYDEVERDLNRRSAETANDRLPPKLRNYVSRRVRELMKNPSSATAADSDPAAFAERFPESERIGHSAGPTRKSAQPSSGRDLDGFAERFPESTRIGGV